MYKAHDKKLDRDVALTFLPAHLDASEQDKARFMREAKAAATLDHPNICDGHGRSRSMAMDYVDESINEAQRRQE